MIALDWDQPHGHTLPTNRARAVSQRHQTERREQHDAQKVNSSAISVWIRAQGSPRQRKWSTSSPFEHHVWIRTSNPSRQVEGRARCWISSMIHVASCPLKSPAAGSLQVQGYLTIWHPSGCHSFIWHPSKRAYIFATPLQAKQRNCHFRWRGEPTLPSQRGFACEKTKIPLLSYQPSSLLSFQPMTCGGHMSKSSSTFPLLSSPCHFSNINEVVTTRPGKYHTTA
jgi:hypothetical protein